MYVHLKILIFQHWLFMLEILGGLYSCHFASDRAYIHCKNKKNLKMCYHTKNIAIYTGTFSKLEGYCTVCMYDTCNTMECIWHTSFFQCSNHQLSLCKPADNNGSRPTLCQQPQWYKGDKSRSLSHWMGLKCIPAVFRRSFFDCASLCAVDGLYGWMWDRKSSEDWCGSTILHESVLDS